MAIASLAVLTLTLLLPMLAAGRIVAAAFPSEGPAGRLLAAICIWMFQLWLAALIVGTLQIATGWTLLIPLLAFLIAATILVPPGDQQTEATWHRHLHGGGGLLFLALMLHLSGLFFKGSKFFSDDYAYHGLAVGAWVSTGTLSHPMINMAAYYPYNPHLVAFALCLPSHDPGSVWIAGFMWVAIVALSFLTLGERVAAGREWIFAAAAVLAIASPQVFWMGEKFASTDLAGAASLLAAFALMVPAPTASIPGRRASLVVSMMLVGFAAGTKPTLIVPGAVAAIGAAWIHIGWGPVRQWFIPPKSKQWALLLGAGFFTSSYWYLRNLILYGNPLFPFQMAGFNGPIRAKDLSHTVMLDLLTSQNPEVSGKWFEAVWALLNWPHAMGLIALAGLVASGIMALRRLAAGAESRTDLLQSPFPWMLLASLAMLAIHPGSPFSGSTLGSGRLEVFSRYIVFVYIAALASGAWVLSFLTWSTWQRKLLLVIDAVAILHALSTFSTGRAGGVLFFTGELALLAVALRWARPSTGRLAFVGLFFVSHLLVLRSTFVKPPHLSVEDWWPEIALFEPGMRAIDELPDGSRIAQLTNRTWENWHLWGSRFQHQPVIVDEHGAELLPLHEAHRRKLIRGPEGHPRFGVPSAYRYNDPERLINNLDSLKLDYLFITKFNFGEQRWAPQRDDVRSSGRWELIWQDGFSEIYRPAPQKEEAP